jgi:hypothetical protein
MREELNVLAAIKGEIPSWFQERVDDLIGELFPQSSEGTG